MRPAPGVCRWTAARIAGGTVWVWPVADCARKSRLSFSARSVRALPCTLGIGGVFSSVTVAEFHITVYAAQAVFGALLGVLVHRFGARIPPLWILVRSVLRARSDRRPPDIT